MLKKKLEYFKEKAKCLDCGNDEFIKVSIRERRCL